MGEVFQLVEIENLKLDYYFAGAEEADLVLKTTLVVVEAGEFLFAAAMNYNFGQVVAEVFLDSDWTMMMVLVSLKMSNYKMVAVEENYFLCSVAVGAEILHCYDLVAAVVLVYVILVVVVALESYSYYLSDCLDLGSNQNCYLVGVGEDKIFEQRTEDLVEIENLEEDDFEVVVVLEIRQSQACDWLEEGEVHDLLEDYYFHH